MIRCRRGQGNLLRPKSFHPLPCLPPFPPAETVIYAMNEPGPSEHRNLLLAIGLSLAILMGFQLLYENPRLKQQQQEQAVLQAAQQDQKEAAAALGTSAPGRSAPGSTIPGSPANDISVPGAVGPAGAVRPREDVLREQTAGGGRVRINSPGLHGSVTTVGGRLDDLTLATYRETADPQSPEIVLLAPSGTQNPYYAEFGWVPGEGSKTALPDASTRWTSSGSELKPGAPLTLSWDNGQGLRFERIYEVDADYMFTVTQRVVNTGSSAVSLLPYALVSRHGTPTTGGYSILHEGPLGVLEGTLKEFKYADLAKQGSAKSVTTGGWIGITDKYWLVSLIPDQTRPVTARFLHTGKAGDDRYQVDILDEAAMVGPGASAQSKVHLFAGAKMVKLLDRYSDEIGITKFDLAIDFGWFYFLTKPFFYALDFLHKLVGNFGIAILLFTVLVKGAVYPLADKSYRSMTKMKAMQPEIKKLQEKYADDRERMNKEMVDLYKREQVNPLSGCLPIFVQIPIFFALYKVLFVTIEMRQAPFFGWIQDLSTPDPTTVFNLFGLIPWTPPEMLHLGLWPLIMGVTMWVQQRLNPPPADPIQAKVFSFLPILFTFMLANFPAGLVIYWTWNNLLSVAQQALIMRRMGVKVSVT